MPQPTLPPRTGDKYKLFFFLNTFIQRCQTSAILNCTTNHYASHGKAIFKTQASSWYRLPTADKATGCDPSVCFVVTLRE
jgi:hypothetical protein